MAAVCRFCTCLVEATGGQSCMANLALALAKLEKTDILFSPDYFLHLLLNFCNETTTSELTLTASRVVGELPRLLRGARGSKGRFPADVRAELRSPLPLLSFPWLAKLFPQSMLKVHRSPLGRGEQCWCRRGPQHCCRALAASPTCSKAMS